MDKMYGCAPSFSLEPDLRGGRLSFSTGYVDILTGARINIDTVDALKSTYAQTIDRNMFSSVGVGTPPFNISMSSPYRSTGFMSETTLFRPDPKGEEDGKSVFKSCKTIEQCFIDRFTYNGRTVKRQVMDPATSTMRNWEGIDGQNCGIFGVWVGSGDKAAFNRLCPGEDFNTRFCCYMDAAVAPLFYMFHYHWNDPITKKVTDTCEGITLPIQNHLRNMGAFYTTSILSTGERNDRLSSIKNRLNQILDEFTPGSRSSPRSPLDTSAADYIRATDCSVALYEALQAFAGCTTTDEAASSRSPFCTSYAAEDKQRHGVYYFMDYTMAEVPFAWWHKCMILQGRTFESQLTASSSYNGDKRGFIECSEWKSSTIPVSSLSKSSHSSIKELLGRLEGGITTQMVESAITQMKINMQTNLTDYINSGFPSLTPEEEMMQQGRTAVKHRGAKSDFNMKCYSKTSMPMSVARSSFINPRTDSDEFDCILDTMWWAHSDKSRTSEWKNKINPACYSLQEKDLIPINSNSKGVAVYTYIRKLTVSIPAKPDGYILSDRLAPLFRGIQEHDFISFSSGQDSVNSSMTDGNRILVAQLWVPDAPEEIKEGTRRNFEPPEFMISGVLNPRIDQDNFWKKVARDTDYTCITVEQAYESGHLIQCPPQPGMPQRLTKKHCDLMYDDMVKAINMYSQTIQGNSNPFPDTRYPKDGECIWDCGYEASDKGPLHIGLNQSERQILYNFANASTQACMTQVDQGTSCFAEIVDSDQGTGITDDDLDGTFEQELCIVTDKGGVSFGKTEGDSNEFDVRDYTPLEVFFSQQARVSVSGTPLTRLPTNKEYKCERVQVQSSKNSKVDAVRAGLSFNDIQVRSSSASVTLFTAK